MQILRRGDRNRLGLDVLLLGTEPGPLGREATDLGARVLVAGSAHAPLAAIPRLARLIRGGRYDVVHSHVHHFSGVVLAVAAREGVPVRVAHSHSSRDGRTDTVVRKGYRRLMTRVLLSRTTDLLACSSPAGLDLYGGAWPDDPRCQRLVCGTDLEPFESPVPRSEIRKEEGVPSGALVVGHVGRFVEPKNHPFVLSVFREVLVRRPDALLALVGDGPSLPQVRRQAHEMGLAPSVRFLGARGDVPRLLGGLVDVLLFPSLWEGLPVAVLEAQAAGVPALVSSAVTTEVAGTGLPVRFLSLGASSGAWADALLVLARVDRPSFEERAAALREAGLDFQGSLSRLEAVYRRRDLRHPEREGA